MKTMIGSSLAEERRKGKYKEEDEELTIEEYFALKLKYVTGGAILRPEITAENFQIKPAFIQMIENNVFFGRPSENPYEHLEKFLEICDMFRIQGCSEDAKRLRLFPFSLQEKAKAWLRLMPSKSITTWDQLAQKFLEKYFPVEKSSKMDVAIRMFGQYENESFPEAWERYRDLLYQIPHHRLEEWSQILTFYEGLTAQSRAIVDSSAGGSFMMMTVKQGWELIERMAEAPERWPSSACVVREETPSLESGFRKEFEEMKNVVRQLAIKDRLDTQSFIQPTFDSKMNSHQILARTLSDILHVLKPTEDDWSKRLQIIKDLQAVVETLEIPRGATVEPFGSFVSNHYSRWGDLDLSIELPNGQLISSVGKKYKKTLLLGVVKAMAREGKFHGIEDILHAKILILKCYSKNDNIACDISVNNLSSQMKSKLLLWISEIDGRFRDMVLIVKEWAKAHGINDPKTGTLDSYSLSLLVIFHFQTCEPAILPPLNEIYPGNMVDALIGVREVAQENIEHICRGNINRIKSDESRRINESSLADLFISFLAKFCSIHCISDAQGISPLYGQWVDMIQQPKTYALFIEDPFEQETNCARAVEHENLPKIAEAFQSSYHELSSPNQNHPSVFLATLQVLRIMYKS